ncbi:GNAT family N-acetyltransferase [Maribacter confluentis]|uniref:GNAT family N-acetyltransferase n=1 Tax=Maribacter confluentis TaxID=1656093 RepID=A0ABT8RLS3_9FLAO|nr:GNAT family N-acetyltransferase [Maribacter confluentis]MDO1511259.1 GNAT family N-acetyltransferase [Maribacter confluentis]
MIQILRTDSQNPDFKDLVSLLDNDLAKRDGEDHSFYAQFNGITHLKHTLVLYEDDMPIACGAIKKFNETSVEVKRMFVLPENRGQGFASKILTELEEWAKELGYKTCVLETGLRQPEAIALYKKNGYQVIANYPPYVGIANSVCFKKDL